MALLEKRFIVTSGGITINKGNNVPPYHTNYKPENWYGGNNGDYFYNIVDGEIEGYRIFIQYGENKAPWVTAKFYYYGLNILNEELLENNSIKATIEINPYYFISRRSVYDSGGVSVKHTVKVNGVTKYSYSGNSKDVFTKTESTQPEVIDVIIAPQETTEKSALNILAEYPNGEFDDYSIFLGVGLFNPNNEPPPEPETYIPMAIRKSNQWKDLDSNNGFIEKRSNGTWEDFSEEEVETSKQVNKGKNRGRENGQWKQLPKMKGGNVDE